MDYGLGFKLQQLLNLSTCLYLFLGVQVIVRSIIDQDPLRPVDESNLVWSDDEEDEKVDNMVSLINTNFQFTSSMFVGGLTKLEVERMRECENVNSKGKKSKKHSLATSSTDPSYIASVVIEKIKPELQTVDGNIVEACRRVDAIEGSMVGLVQSVLAKFKDEMLESVRYLVTDLTKEDCDGPLRITPTGTTATIRENGNRTQSKACVVTQANDLTIRDVLRDISAYSTPPDSPRLSQDIILSSYHDDDFKFVLN